MIYKVIKKDPARGENILKDEIIRLTGCKEGKKYKQQLLCIVVWDEEKQK